MNQQPELHCSTGNASRCQHRFTNRKRCRAVTLDSALPFCVPHAKLHKIEDAAATLTANLTANLTEFKSPAALNDFLSRLLLLLAQNKISARRAAVLAYITNQLLRTVAAIEQQSAAERSAHPKIIIDIPGATRVYEDDPDRPYATAGYSYSPRAVKHVDANEPRNV